MEFDRIEGMLLGLAAGDALGNTTESMLPGERSHHHAEIRDYLPNLHAEGRAVGLPSDDTQMTFWTLEAMLEDGDLVPERVAFKFASRRIFGIGSSVRDFIRNYKSGLPWYLCGADSAGNGALMRIAPVAIPRENADAYVDAALCSLITHNDSASVASCVSFVGMLQELMTMGDAPEPGWWIDRFVEGAREMETSFHYRPRGGLLIEYQDSLWSFVQEHVTAAYSQGLSVLEAGNLWYSGAFLLETVPSALYVLMTHGHDPEEAIVRAVNDTKDNDTIAAIVGAAVGALYGAEAIPRRWRSSLLGRTGADDDGKIFALLERTRSEWFA